jgi:hypothetical protein
MNIRQVRGKFSRISPIEIWITKAHSNSSKKPSKPITKPSNNWRAPS